MRTDNSVVFKGNKDGIDIILDDEVSYDNLKNIFRDKVLQAKKFFGSSDTSISFKGRELSNDEEDELLKIIFRETGLRISFVQKVAIEEQKFDTVLEKKEANETTNIITDNIEESEEMNPKENMTHYHKGSIRSGQSIRFAGSVVVLGDINPGGEIIADGNIIVLGALKGFVHAGVLGNTECFISAHLMTPTQLRIGDIISYIPKEIALKSKKKCEPSVAFIEDGQIYIEII